MSATYNETDPNDQNAVELMCAWSDYKKHYGVSAKSRQRAREFKLFEAGWEAARRESSVDDGPS